MEPVSAARPGPREGGERDPETVFAVPRWPSLARKASPAAPPPPWGAAAPTNPQVSAPFHGADTCYWLACASRYRTLRNACSIA